MTDKTENIVALAPLTQNGLAGLDWFGVALASAIGDKLLVGGLALVPVYDLGLRMQAGSSRLTEWQALAPLSAHISQAAILTGSYLFEEKRVKINIYAVRPTGLLLIASEDDTKSGFMRVIDRLCHTILATYGNPTNAQIRERIQETTPTTNREAFDAMVAALTALGEENMVALRESVALANELDPDYVDPISLLAFALHQAKRADEAEAVQRKLLTHLMTKPTHYRALALATEMADSAPNKIMAQESRKVEDVVREAVAPDATTNVFAQRAQEADAKLMALLAEGERARLGPLRKKGWTIGQIAASHLVARGWLEQTEVAVQTGQYASARESGKAADDLYKALSNKMGRDQARDLLAQANSAQAT
jgi:hypothetical protein